MSDQQPTRPSGPSRRRNPWITALLILIGIILLLPGLCSLILGAILIGAAEPGDNADWLPLLLFLVLVGVGGVALIVFAIRR